MDSALKVLFAPGERWGWESRDVSQLYVPFPKPPPPEPTAVGPALEISGPATDYRRWKLWLWLLIPGIFLAGPLLQLIFFGEEPTGAAKAVAGLMVLTIWIGGYAWLFVRTRTLRRRALKGSPATASGFKEIQQELMNEYQGAVAEWNLEAERYDEEERARLQRLPLHGAVRPATPSRRIDVYGGTVEGWQAFTTTLGASLLGSGQSLSVLDLSEADVASLLFRAAEEAGVPTKVDVLPQMAAQFDLFNGLNPTEIRGLLVEALHSDPSRADFGARSIDDEILASICMVLAPKLTIERIISALGVLLRREPEAAAGAVLSDSEWNGLSDLFNDEYRGVITPNLVRLSAQLSPLREIGCRAVATTAGRGLEGVALSRGGGALLNELLVEILVQRTLQRLRAAEGGAAHVLMIIAADLLATRHIEKLDELAAVQDTRIVYLFRRLRGDVLEVIGGGAGVAAVMRPAGPREAEEAANLIGRQYKFVLSQTSRSLGQSWTSNWGESKSTEGMPTGDVNWGKSLGGSQEKGEVSSRVHEHTVEPEELRMLPPTVLFIAEFSAAGQRQGALVADCNPSLAALSRISTVPFEEADSAASRGR